MATIPAVNTKRLAISKANAQIVAAVGVAAFITVFCLVASKAVFVQNRYQAKVTTAKEAAHQQLRSNLAAFNSLSTLYRSFDKTTTNVIGGSSTGTGDNDGPNSKIILDALPSTYDFPALTSSLEKMLSNKSYKVGGISGTDDQLAQQSNDASATPTAIAIPFSLTISEANYTSANEFITMLQHSIRPMPIDTLSISGGDNSISVSVSAHTFYEPGKTVNIGSKVVAP